MNRCVGFSGMFHPDWFADRRDDPPISGCQRIERECDKNYNVLKAQAQEYLNRLGDEGFIRDVLAVVARTYNKVRAFMGDENHRTIFWNGVAAILTSLVVRPSPWLAFSSYFISVVLSVWGIGDVNNEGRLSLTQFRDNEILSSRSRDGHVQQKVLIVVSALILLFAPRTPLQKIWTIPLCLMQANSLVHYFRAQPKGTPPTVEREEGSTPTLEREEGGI